jgi:hypothetical protein
MPLFAALVKGLFGSAISVMLALAAARESIRLSGVLLLAAVYLVAVVAYSTFISPLLSSLFATSYGQVIGLAFPPIAGTVITGLSALWVTLLAKRYIVRFGSMALPK